VVFFDQNALTGEWRAQMRCCEERDIALHRNITFALAVADILELPDDLPLMPAVTAVMSVPIFLSDPGSLAHLKAVARAAAVVGMNGLTRDEARLVAANIAKIPQYRRGGASSSKAVVIKSPCNGVNRGLADPR
jgi:hypothetical protein